MQPRKVPTGREVMEEPWRQRRAGADPRGREEEPPTVNASETSEEMAVASGFLGKQLLLFPLCSPLVGEDRSSWSPSGLEGGL